MLFGIRLHHFFFKISSIRGHTLPNQFHPFFFDRCSKLFHQNPAQECVYSIHDFVVILEVATKYHFFGARKSEKSHGAKYRLYGRCGNTSIIRRENGDFKIEKFF